MSTTSNRKRKLHCGSSRESKIVRAFINGWVESDVNGTSPSENGAPPISKTSPTTISTKYPNFVKSSADNPPAGINTAADPGLDQRLIQRLRPVIAYMYNEDKISLKLSFEQAGLLLESGYDDQSKVFRYTINEREICSASGEQQDAHSKARDALVRILQYYCYTVKRLKDYHTRRNVFRKMPNETKNSNFKEHQLGEGNIGFQMLQKQGWAGGSLGSSEEGILEPIGVQKRDNKAGLGSKTDSTPQKIPIEAFILAIKQYAAGNALYDLVFSPQFSKHQVIKLRDLASSLKLFPQMLGKRKQLVISKKLTLRELKIGVLKGHSDLCAKYAVIPPIYQESN